MAQRNSAHRGSQDGLVAAAALAVTAQDPAPAVVGQVLHVAAERLVDPQPGVGEQRDAGACCRIDNILSMREMQAASRYMDRPFTVLGLTS